jgi:hypothetical protein
LAGGAFLCETWAVGRGGRTRVKALFPAVALELQNKTAPLLGSDRMSRSCRLAQPNFVRQGLRRVPFAQHDFTDGKGSQEIEFVRGRVERIPQRFKRPATFLREDFLAPNGFGHLLFFCFKPRQLSCPLADDLAADFRRISEDGEFASRAEQQQCDDDENKSKQPEEKKFFAGSAHTENRN